MTNEKIITVCDQVRYAHGLGVIEYMDGDMEVSVKAYCIGSEGWHPGVDDTVVLYEEDGVHYVEPVGWNNPGLEKIKGKSAILAARMKEARLKKDMISARIESYGLSDQFAVDGRGRLK